MFRKTAVFFNLALCLGFLSPGALAQIPQDNQSGAVLSEAKGSVFKRDYVDWKRDQWKDPEPAKLGDRLVEGMQVGTGTKSWAEVKWPNVVARAWENSVFAVSPNRRLVYLTNGDMLFRLDKNRKTKDNYFVWTKMLQARIHGTTVLFHTTPTSSQITVLEGSIVVSNRKDHSSIKIGPGVVYEVREKGASPDAAGIPTIGQNPVKVFETSTELTTLSLADTGSLLQNPLATQFTDKLDSLPLIQQAFGLLPQVQNLPSALTNLPVTIKLNTEILSPPVMSAYQMGGQALNQIAHVPNAFQNFPPSSLIDGTTHGISAKLSNLATTGLDTPSPLTMLDNSSALQLTSNVAAISTAVVGSSQYGEIAALSAPRGALASGILPGGATGGLGGILGGGGPLGGVGGLLGGLGGGLGGLGGGLGGLGGGLGGLGGGLGGLGGGLGLP